VESKEAFQRAAASRDTTILRKSRMRRRACTDLCGGRSAMVVPTATVIASSAALVPTNALVLTSLITLRVVGDS
jgi:hypothetical protein